MTQFKVRFTVTFETTVDLDEGQSLSDACADLFIPEDEQTKYVEDTFEVDSVTDVATGKTVEPDEYDAEHGDEDEEED